MVESPDMPSPLRVQKTNFQHRSQKIDWRKLASVDLETMSQNGDFAVLQDNIQHVTFCDVREEFPNVDLNLVKLFRLAQLIIQYFLQSQDALINSISDLRSSVSSRTKEAEDAEAATALALSELKTLRKENKFLKRTLYKESCEGGSYPWKCGACPKIFISGEYLKAHVERRHGGDPVAAVPLQPSSRISTGVVNVESRNVEAEEESRRLLEENAHLSRELALLRDELSEQEVRLRREISSSVNKGLALGLAEQRSHEISEDIAREIQKLKEVLFTELQTRRPDFSEERKRLELKAESQEKEIQELRKLLESEERVGSEQLQKLSMENQHRLEAQLRDIDDKYHRGLEKLESCIQNQRDVPPISSETSIGEALRDSLRRELQVELKAALASMSLGSSAPPPIPPPRKSREPPMLPKRASGGSRPRPSPPVLEEPVQKEESLGTVKEDVTSDLTERLQRAGIPGDAWTIEESKLAATMAQIKRERKEFEKEMPKYSSVQSTLNRSIDQQIRLQGVTPPRRHKERGFRTVIHSIRKRVLGGSAFSWRHHDGKSRSLEALAKSLPHSAEPKLFNAEKESQRFGGSTPALNTASSRHTLGVVQPSYTPSDLEYDDDLDSVDAERGTPIDTDFHRRGDQGRRVHFSRPGASFENESTSDWSDEEEEPILKKIPVQTLPKASSKLEQDASLEDVEEEILEEFYGDPSPNVKPKIALRKTSSWDSE